MLKCYENYFTPCISLLIAGPMINKNTPPPISNQKLKLKPLIAELTVIPVSPLIKPANMPEKLLPIAVLKNHPPKAIPAIDAGTNLLTIDKPIGDKHSSPIVCNT